MILIMDYQVIYAGDFTSMLYKPLYVDQEGLIVLQVWPMAISSGRVTGKNLGPFFRRWYTDVV